MNGLIVAVTGLILGTIYYKHKEKIVATDAPDAPVSTHGLYGVNNLVHPIIPGPHVVGFRPRGGAGYVTQHAQEIRAMPRIHAKRPTRRGPIGANVPIYDL